VGLSTSKKKGFLQNSRPNLDVHVRHIYRKDIELTWSPATRAIPGASTCRVNYELRSVGANGVRTA
jgi:hypothetical protein